MLPISPYYLDAIRRHDREWLVKADIAGVEYDNTKIVEFSIENSLTLSDEFELGTTILSKLTITLRTQDEIPPNARMVPYVALNMGGTTWADANFPWNQASWAWIGGAGEWLPLGEFFVDSREQINDTWVYTCYDKLVFADVPYISSLTYPATMKAVWDEICGRLGYQYDSSIQINSSYKIEVGPAGYSMRQVLGYIASANSASLYVGKDGLLKFKQFKASDRPVFTMTPSDYIRVIPTNPLKTFKRVVVTYNTEDDYSFEAGTGDENETLYIENPFATEQITNDLLAKLNGFSYLPIQMDSRGFPQFEVGDVISFERQESRSWIDTNSTWEDTQLPWDGVVGYKSIILHQVYSFRGGLKMTIEAPAKSDQQSEFVVEGSLTQQINKLNSTSVKLGKPYHGVTIDRTKGIFTELSDHSSQLTINSQVLLDWVVNGTRKLYYDENEDAIKFSGTIEAGKIIGSEITGSIIQTSKDSFPRVEINPEKNLFSAMKSNAEMISISPSSIGVSSPSLLFETNNSPVGMMQVTGGNLLIGTTMNDIQISASSNLYLSAHGGFIRIASWNELFSIANGLPLGTVLDSKANRSYVSGAFYVSSTPGGPANKIIEYTNGVITNVY